MNDLMNAIELVRSFKGSSLALTVAQLEHCAEACDVQKLKSVLNERSVSTDLLKAAVTVKRASAQIDEVVHAVGTLLCLQEILEDGERIECVSLAAGNAGRSFDLATNRRIAEFTFIEWKGGSESIRKQKLFKDFYVLSEQETDKRRFVYVVGNVHPQRVFCSRSPCIGMLRKFALHREAFTKKYGTAMTVRDYYELKKHLVEIVDLNGAAPQLSAALS